MTSARQASYIFLHGLVRAIEPRQSVPYCGPSLTRSCLHLISNTESLSSGLLPQSCVHCRGSCKRWCDMYMSVANTVRLPLGKTGYWLFGPEDGAKVFGVQMPPL